MKPVWVKVDWEVPTFYVGDQITVRPIFVEKIGELELIDGVYIGTEYHRFQSGILSIGIVADVPFQKVTAYGTFGFRREMTENNQALWISCPVYEWNQVERQYEVSIPSLGVNQCGTFIIEGQSLENQDLYKCEVKVRSSLLSEGEYLMMKHDLLTITEDLMYRNYTSDDGNDGKRTHIDLAELENLVHLLNDILVELEKAPAEKLIEKRIKTHVDKLRKMDTRALLEQELYLYSDTVRAITTVRSLDVPEHRKLKGAIFEFISICERNLDTEKMHLRSIVSQLAELYEEKIKVNDSIFYEKFASKEESLTANQKQFEERQEAWFEIVALLETLLESELLCHCEPEEWGDTHLFIFHSEYVQAFELVEEIRKQLRQDNVSLKNFQRDVLNSPDLYEKWTLLKVIHHFMETWRLTSEHGNVMQKLLKYYQKYQTLRGFWIRLKLIGSTNLVIGSEITFGNKRPDLTLLVEENNGFLFFLDAKYKPYSRMQKQLGKDLARSATRYRLMDDRGKAAFLIHPDQECGSHFEVMKPHRDGYYLLKPGQDEGLALFAKMVLHFHLRKETICPDCGEKNNINKEDLTYKKYYTCKSCNSFWVQSKCWNRNHVYQHLYKYLHRNYHRPTDHDWDVHCPTCGLTYADSRRGNR